MVRTVLWAATTRSLSAILSCRASSTPRVGTTAGRIWQIPSVEDMRGIKNWLARFFFSTVRLLQDCGYFVKLEHDNDALHGSSQHLIS
jgi:hypothetical protein